MTTQWNPSPSGDTGPERYRAEGEDRENGPAARNSDEPDLAGPHTPPSQSEETAPYQGGPWRGYTMPVPEHPEHAEEHERILEDPSAFEPPAYDGITGYPDPSGAGSAQSVPRETPRPAANAPARSRSQTESSETSQSRQRRFGRHSRSVASSAGEGDPDGNEAGDQRRQSGSDHDDPDGLAGWVGSLTDAAEDSRIAGRNTGGFPVVGPDPEGGDGQGGRPASRTGGRVAEPEEDERAGDGREQDPAERVQRESTRAWAGNADAGFDLLSDDPTGTVNTGTAAASSTGSEPANAGTETVSETGADADDGPPPLPRRVPGPSAVSGAFRAIGADTTAPAAAAGSAADQAPGPSDTDSGHEGGPDPREADEEYRPTSHDHWQPTNTTSRAELIERLDALSTLTELGQDDLPEEALSRAGQLLDHAGARLRLSGEHTVVALAGGTGSGKSSLFNALCGLELSQTGVTRPTTSKAHACVWGHEGADALLSWLGVPTRYRHSRTSVLDSSNSELTGLVLLDLPDHDSVRSMHTAEADRLIGSVDLLVWVLDPQKYADAAVHHRYLAKMAGHGAVTVAVLNQVDKVASDDLEELLTDLRRLLETESGVHPRVITTSTVTGQGIRDVREFLSETVTERRALVDRLVADLDQVVEHFEKFHGEGEAPEAVPAQVRARLQEGLAKAAGVTAVADVVETNDVRRGKRRVGWPVARRAAKLRKDPLAAVQLDFLRRHEPGLSGPVDAHEAELETVLGEAADQVSDGMPGPWRRRMRTAARSGVGELPTELGEAVAGAVGDPDRSPSWWRMARAVQYALLTVAGVGLAWALLSLVSWLGGGLTGLRMFDDPIFVAYSGAVVVAGLLVGWLTGVGCGNLVEVAAVQRREDVERTAQGRVREIAGTRVVASMESELARYRAFRAAYEVARVKADPQG